MHFSRTAYYKIDPKRLLTLFRFILQMANRFIKNMNLTEFLFRKYCKNIKKRVCTSVKLRWAQMFAKTGNFQLLRFHHLKFEILTALGLIDEMPVFLQLLSGFLVADFFKFTFFGLHDDHCPSIFWFFELTQNGFFVLHSSS